LNKIKFNSILVLLKVGGGFIRKSGPDQRDATHVYVAFYTAVCLPTLTTKGAKFGMTAEVMKSYAAYFGGLGFAILSVVNLLCAFFGALIGIRILKKHFKKAGLIR
jgi:hypothetical protein